MEAGSFRNIGYVLNIGDNEKGHYECWKNFELSKNSNYVLNFLLFGSIFQTLLRAENQFVLG